MNFNVFWIPSAEDQLANIWTAASDRTAVARAADRIDQLLGLSPLTVGESRPDGRRILIVLPLVVYYDIDEPDRRVRVLKVIPSRSLS